MSLFRSKEWWSINLNESEQYDSQCLLVSTIGKDRYQSILLGSHDGFFRIYMPSSGISDDGEVVGFRPSDLLMEMQLPAPILQMSMGTLVSGSHDRNLAILHPKLLTVYLLNKKDNGGGTGDQVSVEIAYQHQLRHSAYSFVVGAFGGSRGRDFICVQALDGLLSFYEQESFAFQLYLTDFLLPSPFVYLDKIDCFVFLNASLILDCFSYENLASASQAEGEDLKKILKYWSYNIGESILDVKAVGGEVSSIIVLTERNLYNISESGQMIFMKRLEYVPMSFCAFLTAEERKLMILIATDNCLLNIYEGTCLKWSAKVDQIPVSIERIILSNLYGGIVLLSENGYMECIYLGTHPSVYLMPPMVQPDINVAEAEAELKRLQVEISDKDTIDPVEVDLISVGLTVDTTLSEEEFGSVCRMTVEITSQTPVNKIHAVFVVDPPLLVGEKSITVSCCDKTVIDNYVYLGKHGTVANLNVKVCLSYVNSTGAPFVVEQEGRLPLNLVLEKTNPAKEAKHKITVVTNKPVCPLSMIFREFVEEDTNPNVVGLKYKNSDAAVTVLTAKTTQRYRLQSDSLESIALVLSLVLERLKAHFRGVPDLVLSYDGALPLHTYFQEIEHYHALLQERKLARERLTKRTCQYRTIQKKVLMNLQDATPKPISGLNSILSNTYEMILSSVEELEATEKQLEMCRYCINSLCPLLVSLLELMSIAPTDLEYLRIIFTGHVYDTDDQGWLEVQLAAASFFLRTALAKSARDQQKPTDITLDQVSNVSKVLKSFTAVVDRATKGTHLLERSEYEPDKEILPTIYGLMEVEEDVEVHVIPKGSKLADLSISTAESSSMPPTERKEKRLMKQERVDSLGMKFSASNSEDDTPGRVPKEKEQPWEAEDQGEEEKEDEEGGEKSVADLVEDDAIWDVKVDEMRI